MGNYPVPYQSNWGNSGGFSGYSGYSGLSGVGQQMYPQYAQSGGTNTAPAAQIGGGLIWVDGEVGAKAYQIPQGWPANQPIALWDTNDTVIYLKSTNPMGMPNPIQKAHYTLEEHKSTNPMRSGDTEPEHPAPDMTEYVRKDDMERMKRELMDTINGLSISGRKTTGE